MGHAHGRSSRVRLVEGCMLRGGARSLVMLLAIVLPVWAADVSVRKVEAIEGDETVVQIHLSGPLSTPPKGRLLTRGKGQPDRLVIDLVGADLHGKAAHDVR